MDSHYQVHIRENLKRLITAHASSIAVCEEMLAVLQAELDAASAPPGNSIFAQSSKRTGDGPFVDRTLLSVTYRGQSCFLGNTLALRLLERLLHRPNQYVSYEQLQDDVWNAVRSPSAIRSVVKDLRSKLKLAGMRVLAEAIDGQAAGHYRLSLNSVS